jgi:phenylalanine-4-hydroxylase
MNVFDERRKAIISLASGPNKTPKDIDYVSTENEVWQAVSECLVPLWDKFVVSEVLDARAKLNLPTDHVPQLSDVTKGLNRLSGFTFRSVGGLAKRDHFFEALAKKQFLSTQYLRHPSSPFYTDEPDIIHEVIGHGTLLVIPELAELHRLAGAALIRVKTEEAKNFIANVWWFSGEFGVLTTGDGLKAFGAGLLSSVGELENFTKNAEIRPLDIAAMGLTPYKIDEFQKLLFGGYSIHQIFEVVGGFFAHVTDQQVTAITQAHRTANGLSPMIDGKLNY